MVFMLLQENGATLGYIRGLLTRLGRGNCVRIAERTRHSHDSLTRFLSRSVIDAEMHIRMLFFALRTQGRIGSIIIDDTTVNKEFAKVIEGCSWVWSSAKEKVVFGYGLVAICWSDGDTVIPIAWKLYDPDSGKTRIDLAVELLGYVRKWLKYKPEYVLFDAYYSADKVLRRCRAYGWTYLGRVKKNRTLNGTQARKLHRNPYWSEVGKLSCGIRARIVRHGKRYFITNDFDLERKAIATLYGDRWPIEEVFRVLHSTLGLDECESRSLQSQTNHIALCMLAYHVLENEKTRTGTTWYESRHNYMLEPSLADNAVNALFLGGA